METQIEIKDMPALEVAYVPHVGPYNQVGEAFHILMPWAATQGLMGNMTATVYHDDPETTPQEESRQSACILLNGKSVALEGAVKFRTIPADKCAVGMFEVGMHEFEQAWQTVFDELEKQGYEFDKEKDPYEIYHNDFNTHPEKKCIVEICVQVANK